MPTNSTLTQARLSLCRQGASAVLICKNGYRISAKTVLPLPQQLNNDHLLKNNIPKHREMGWHTLVVDVAHIPEPNHPRKFGILIQLYGAFSENCSPRFLYPG